jgi:periplasmic protein TonB
VSERPSAKDRGEGRRLSGRKTARTLHVPITLAWFNFSAGLFRLSSMERMQTALVVSAVLHGVVLLGTQFKMPDPRKFRDNQSTLEVVLVNSKSAERPSKPLAYAQANLDGGGNVDAKRRARSPLPVRKDEMSDDPQRTTRKVEQMEAEARKLMTQLRSERNVASATEPGKRAARDPAREPTPAPEAAPSEQELNAEFARRSQQIASLEAEIAKQWDAYQQRPKRKFIGARTVEYRFARYVEDWRTKIEKIGTERYPEAARKKKIYGNLLLTVAIRSNGSVENIQILRSSGHKILDAAAIRIVETAQPFGAFPHDIREDTDVLHITRTWTFTKAAQLVSE